MKTRKTVNQKIDPLYIELFEERAASEMRDRRPLKNLKKAWMEHTEDYDEVDEFYEH
jgi:hypothetical protein